MSWKGLLPLAILSVISGLAMIGFRVAQEYEMGLSQYWFDGAMAVSVGLLIGISVAVVVFTRKEGSWMQEFVSEIKEQVAKSKMYPAPQIREIRRDFLLNTRETMEKEYDMALASGVEEQSNTIAKHLIKLNYELDILNRMDKLEIKNGN